MHCQQGLGTEGRPRNEEQEQCFDKDAVTGITTRMSNHMQTSLWKSVGKACRAQKSEHSLSSWDFLRAATADTREGGARHARSCLLRLVRDPRNLPKT